MLPRSLMLATALVDADAEATALVDAEAEATALVDAEMLKLRLLH
ncbi:hypothetical protein [Streptococcus mitis]|nr:hypothetical protein [Streptococcus mitis]